MLDIQQIFSEIKQFEKEAKGLREQYRDALSQTEKYQELQEEIKEKREKKKSLEARVQQEMGKAFDKLEELKSEIAVKKEMLNDVAITTLMDGKAVEVVDEFQNRYEPLYVVRFKKTNEVRSA